MTNLVYGIWYMVFGENHNQPLLACFTLDNFMPRIFLSTNWAYAAAKEKSSRSGRIYSVPPRDEKNVVCLMRLAV